MSGNLTREQEQIARLFGTLEVLEELVVTMLGERIDSGGIEPDRLKRLLMHLRDTAGDTAETAWGTHHAQAANDTAIRINAKADIGGWDYPADTSAPKSCV